MKNYEDKIYSLGETVTGQTQTMSQAVQKTLENNGGVGIMTGSYDQNLSILSVNNLLLHSTGYTFDTFMEQTKGSLRNFFYDEEDILERDRFLQLHGTGEAQILAADGTVNNVRLCKEDATDEAGRQIWVMSVQVNWDHVNLALLNEAICSGFWYFDCDENSEIVNANWSHEFRKMLGYHDTLDFPNKLESWSDLLHPQDKERVMVQLQAAIKDKTNQIKYQVEYRMRMKDNQYQWFRASAEVIRRLDGSASRIAGIFINIDAEKKEIMQAQKSAAFHRAFTKADLCEYYVNLEANTFDTFKVEPSLMTVFEQSHTWDELIRHFVDSYVVETDKKAVSSFYDRGYIAERLKGLETELALECRITLNGEERWVRNVVIRGEIEDSEYAMIFLRDITEAKVESARHLQMAADNASMEQLIQSIVRLVDRFVVCDLENDRYEFYNLNGQMIYKPLGFYHDFQMQVLEKYKTLEPLEAIDILIAPDNIRKKLKSENDIYKFEYCSQDEKTYKIASSQEADPKFFYIEDGEIKSGDGITTVEKDGIYRVKVDFSNKSVITKEIKSMGLWHCWDRNVLLDLPYIGNGVFEGTGTISPSNNDNRYKLLMVYADDSELIWGTKNDTDVVPGANPDPSYFYIMETNDNAEAGQWDRKWKFNDGIIGNNTKVRVIFTGENYTHSIEPVN